MALIDVRWDIIELDYELIGMPMSNVIILDLSLGYPVITCRTKILGQGKVRRKIRCWGNQLTWWFYRPSRFPWGQICSTDGSMRIAWSGWKYFRLLWLVLGFLFSLLVWIGLALGGSWEFILWKPLVYVCASPLYLLTFIFHPLQTYISHLTKLLTKFTMGRIQLFPPSSPFFLVLFDFAWTSYNKTIGEGSAYRPFQIILKIQKGLYADPSPA